MEHLLHECQATQFTGCLVQLHQLPDEEATDWIERLKVKGRDIYIYRHLHEHDQQRFTIFAVAYWPAMTLGGTAQVAAAHCPNERNLNPAVWTNHVTYS